MDKYKLGIGDAEFLDFWHVLTKFKTGLGIMEAIEATIAEDFDGAVLGKLVTIEDRVKVCMAFMRFLRDVEPQLLFKLSGTEATPGILIDETFTTNGEYNASDIIEGAAGFGKVTVDVPQETPNLGSRFIDANGIYNASDEGYDGYSEVTVEVPQGIINNYCEVTFVNNDPNGNSIDMGYTDIDVETKVLVYNTHTLLFGETLTVKMPYTRDMGNVTVFTGRGFSTLDKTDMINCHDDGMGLIIDDITQNSSVTLSIKLML